MTELQEDEELTVHIPLPPTCRGTDGESIKRRKAFVVDALRKAYAQGKVVLSNRFVLSSFSSQSSLTGSFGSVVNDQLVLSYVLDVDPDGGDATTRDMDLDSTPDQEDVKPVLQASAPVIRHTTPLPVVEEPLPDPVYFPRTLQKSFLDSPETERHVQEFLTEYVVFCCSRVDAVLISNSIRFFDRFDSSRGLLIDFYTLDAVFSINHVKAVPARLRTRPNPFSTKYPTDALFITPTPIVNAIRRIPAGRHDLAKCIYDAWMMDPTRIFLSMHGEFEEFPSGNLMSFDRQFILVPKRGAAGCPASHLVKSDTLIYRHHLPPPAPIDLAPRSPPASTANARSVHKRPAPVESDSEDDCIVVDAPPAPPVAPPAPAPVPQKRKRILPAPPPALFSRVVLPARARQRISARSASPEAGLPAAGRDAAVARRSAREATFFNELVEPETAVEDAAWRDEMKERFSMLQRQLAQFDHQLTAGPPPAPPKKVIAPIPEQRAPSAPPTADEEDDQLDSDDDLPGPSLPPSTRATLVKTGTSVAVSHQHGSKTNKMRYFFANDHNYLAVSSFGDVLEWDSKKQYFDTRHTGPKPTDRVDAMDCTKKGTLVLGYQGLSSKQEDQPQYQLAMYRSSDGQRARVRAFETKPHAGGISAVTCLSEKRFVTAGFDKASVPTFSPSRDDRTDLMMSRRIHLWSIDRESATLTARTTRIPSEHTALISMLRSYDGGKRFISAGMDKRVCRVPKLSKF